jgi:hypothetical protein
LFPRKLIGKRMGKRRRDGEVKRSIHFPWPLTGPGSNRSPLTAPSPIGLSPGVIRLALRSVSCAISSPTTADPWSADRAQLSKSKAMDVRQRRGVDHHSSSSTQPPRGLGWVQSPANAEIELRVCGLQKSPMPERILFSGGPPRGGELI